MSLRWQCMCVDSTDPGALARWWAELLGWRITHEADDETVLEPPAGSAEDGVSPDILFLRVPEGRSVKNRLHVDLRPDDQAEGKSSKEAIRALKRRISDRVFRVVVNDARRTQTN